MLPNLMSLENAYKRAKIILISLILSTIGDEKNKIEHRFKKF